MSLKDSNLKSQKILNSRWSRINSWDKSKNCRKNWLISRAITSKWQDKCSKLSKNTKTSIWNKTNNLKIYWRTACKNWRRRGVQTRSWERRSTTWRECLPRSFTMCSKSRAKFILIDHKFWYVFLFWIYQRLIIRLAWAQSLFTGSTLTMLPFVRYCTSILYCPGSKGSIWKTWLLW